jgi:hypothetical protein
VPIAFIGADDEIPAPTDGEAYEITFNFTSEASVIDLSVGKRPKRFIGEGVLSTDGRGQTVTVNGSDSATHYLRLKNGGLARTVSARLRGVPATIPVEVMELGPGKRNVTAAFLSGRYRKRLGMDDSQRFSVMVSAITRIPDGPPTRTPVAVTRPLDRLILTTVSDSSDAKVSDTAGARVRLR